MSKAFNVRNVCRTCLSNVHLKSLYDKSATKNNLAEMLMICTPVEYYENDGLPINICVDCISKIKQSYEFALQCRESDEKLRIHLQKLLPDNCAEMIHDKDEFSESVLAVIKHEFIDNEVEIETEPEPDPTTEAIEMIKVSHYAESDEQQMKNGIKQTDICNKAEKQNGQVNQCNKLHQKNHIKVKIGGGERPYSCTACDKSFKRKDHLKNHKRTHSEQKQYACTVCPSSFHSEITLNTHVRTHAGDRPYACEQCERSFNLKSNFNRHLRMHAGVKVYACSVCPSAFSEKSDLARHMRKHTGEKPYSCKICNSTFKRKDILKNHMRTHTGEKPYACAICGHCFNHQHHLNNHVRTHTGEKPFSCTICKKLFQRNDTLKIHMRRQHTKQ